MRQNKTLFLTTLLALLLSTGQAHAVLSDAPSGADGQALGSAADALACPYINRLQNAEAGSYDALLIKIGGAESSGIYMLRGTSNHLGKYQLSEAALQICVEDDGNMNNDYGAGLAPMTQQTIMSTDREVWKPGACLVQPTGTEADLTEVSANIRNSDDFLRNPCIQEAIMRKNLDDLAPLVMNNPDAQFLMCKKVMGLFTIEHEQSSASLGETVEAGTFITPSGLLYAAHVWGVDGLLQALRVYRGGGAPAASLPTYTRIPDPNDPTRTISSEATPAGTATTYPAGTLVTDGQDMPWTATVAAANYFEMPTTVDISTYGPACLAPTSGAEPGAIVTCRATVAGTVECPAVLPYVAPEYGQPPQVSTDYPFDKPGDLATLPPPRKLLKQIVHEIREKAGIIPEKIAENPSYNETMLAFTKERFLDPNYYIDLADDASAIQQELTMLDAYINIQMKDIYDMQERINALLAARASLKINFEDVRPSHDELSKK